MPNLFSFGKSFMRLALNIMTVPFLLSTSAYACSSEGPAALIFQNKAITLRHAILSVVMILAIIALYFLRKRKGLPVIVLSLILLAFQPAWVYGGGGGDCGRGMVETAKWVTLLIAGGFTYQLVLWLMQRKQFP
jgi:uncharacterized membrane protein (UPF0136 family)